MKVSTCSKYIALIFFGSSIAICEAGQKESLEIRDHVFTFEQSANTDKSIDAEYQSTISVKKKGADSEIYKQVSTLEPSCGKVPKFQKLNENLIALCGHLGGRHYTYKFFRISASGPEVTTLDSFDGAPEIVNTNNGSISLLVIMRDRFSEITGPVYFPYVYQLYSDENAFGFHLDYGVNSRQQYRKFYADIKSTDDKNYLPVKIATLMAIQDEKFVCDEIKEIKQKAENKNAGSLQNSIEKWMKKLPSVGYPTFNLNDC